MTFAIEYQRLSQTRTYVRTPSSLPFSHHASLWDKSKLPPSLPQMYHCLVPITSLMTQSVSSVCSKPSQYTSRLVMIPTMHFYHYFLYVVLRVVIICPRSSSKKCGTAHFHCPLPQLPLAFMITGLDWTYHAHQFIFSFSFTFFVNSVW